MKIHHVGTIGVQNVFEAGEEKEPTIATRVPKEDKERTIKMAAEEGISHAQFLREGWHLRQAYRRIDCYKLLRYQKEVRELLAKLDDDFMVIVK